MRMKYKVTPKPRYNLIYCTECVKNLATYIYKGDYYCGDCVLQKAVVNKDLQMRMSYYTSEDKILNSPFDCNTALNLLKARAKIREIK